jgi:uncharacterized protein YbjT (DUF2867 family)
MAQDTALIVGATGLVGGYCLKALLDGEDYRSVIALTRRPLDVQHPRLVPMIVDFEKLDEIDPFPAADVFCALGTTIERAGSQHAFLKVDFEYGKNVAERSAAATGRHHADQAAAAVAVARIDAGFNNHRSGWVRSTFVL